MFLKFVLGILFCVLKVHCNINNILVNNPNIDNDKASQCVVDIIKNKFSKTTIIFYGNGEHDFKSSVLTEIAEDVAENGIPVAYIDERSINQTKNVFKVQPIAIAHITNCKSLIDITNNNIVKNENSKYLLILDEILLSECYNSFKIISSKIADFRVALIYEDKIRNLVNITTFIHALDAKTCDFKNNTKLIHLTTCKNESFEGINVDIFPNKNPKNWMSCPINVGLDSIFPYANVFNKTERNDDDVAEGSDIEILKIVADYFNASLKFFPITTDDDNALWKTSFLKSVLNGSLEVCAGGLYRVYGDIVSYSGVYLRQEMIWVYTVERNKPSWMAFTRKTDEFYIFIIFYIFYTLIWYTFRNFDKDAVSISSTFIYAWGTLFGGANLQNARSTKQMILNMFYLILSMHLYAYVCIELYPFLTLQAPPKVYIDAEELSESGKPVYLIDNAKYFIEDEKYIALANKSQSCIDFDDCIDKIVANKGTTIIVDGLLAPVQVATDANGEARVLKASEPLIVVYHEMIIRKYSPLLGRFEKIISRLLEAGICEKLYEDAIGILVLDEAHWASRNMMTNSYSCEAGCTITLSQCAGAFYAWILGCVVSICAFFSEIAIKRKH